jgi:hypothetical protein
MKKTNNYYATSMLVFLLIAVSIAVLSCGKNNDVTPKIDTTITGFTFKADGGATVTVDSANAVLYTPPFAGAMRTMDVYAFKGGKQVLEFHFAPATGAKSVGGTFGMGGTLLTYIAPSPLQSFDSQSGTLNLTTCDTVGNKIIGDFNFVAKEYPYTGTTTHSITEGHMSVTKLSKQ